MRSLLAALAVLVSASAVAGTIDSGWPPERLQHDGIIWGKTYFTNNIEAHCGKAPEGWRFVGCVIGKDTLVLLNPCSPEFRREKYARIACHELGHINGWSGEHERP